jgi:protein-S-isoprenylcysteine O-methyltransferase Ste14
MAAEPGAIQLWLRGIAFTLLLPVMIGGAIPYWVGGPGRALGGSHALAWIPLALAAALYLLCLLRFMLAQGVPYIWFPRELRWLCGERAGALIREGPYAFSRNPMYTSVVTASLAQAWLYGNWIVALYAALAAASFATIVVVVEEPQQRRLHGAAYDDYCLRVPRWLGRVRG